MASQTLRTVVTIGGRVDNSFGQIGDNLISLGSMIDTVSQKVINFGKESVKEFVNYDDAMRSVQALGEYSSSTMQALDDYNKSVAKSSKWTMEQLANAETLIAQLGLPLEEMYTLMPTVMSVATAAGIDMAESLDYLYYTLVALDQPMSYAATLGDQMAKASAISAADIDTLGLSLQRLGSASQFFAGGSDELLAILAGISQFGADMQGTSAGTQLRNFMLTLLAPTAGKSKIMESFGVSEAEWAEFESYMDDAEISVTDTADAMNRLGMSCYDAATGELKPAIQIIGELNAALATMSEAERTATLGQLFGKRTTVTASNLLAALPTIIDYWHQIENESAGYAQYTADTKEGGLGGTLRELAAGWNELKTAFGETISPEVEAVSGFLHNIATDVSSMDEEQMAAIAGGLAGIAAAGPGMLILGGAVRLIGFAKTPWGKAALGISLLSGAVGALYGHFSRMAEIDLKGSFGDMELDASTLTGHLKTIEDSFKATYSEVDKYSAALKTAVDSYTTASSTLSGDLLTTMITGTTLTQEQIGQISGLGDSMGQALRSGIETSMAGGISYLKLMMGGTGNEDYNNAVDAATSIYDQFLDEAKQLGDEFGKTLGEAMNDGIITGDEYDAILKKMRAYDEAMAVQASAQRAGEVAVQLHKAAGMSWDSAEEFLSTANASQKAELERLAQEYVNQSAYWGFIYDDAIKRAESEDEAARILVKKNALLGDGTEKNPGSLLKAYNDNVQAETNEYAQIVMRTFQGLMSGSDYAEAWPLLQTLLGDTSGYARNPDGSLRLDNIDWAALDASGQITEGMGNMLFGLSKNRGMFEKYFAPYMDNPEIAKAMEQMEYAYALSEYINAYYLHKGTGGTGDAYDDAERAAQIQQIQDELAAARAMEAEYAAQIAQRENWLNGNDRPWYYGWSGGDGANQSVLDSLYADQAAVQQSIAELEAQLRELGGVGVDAHLVGLTESAAAEQAAVQAYYNSNPVTLPGYVDVNTPGSPMDTYAEGGRATEASIFGEAGAEWAIPEEHTDNTASLLWRAAQASGFTWQDIAAANGQGVSSRAGTTLVYSPTIVAADATGVEQKLREDKDRLERWLQERELKDSIAVYA